MSCAEILCVYGSGNPYVHVGDDEALLLASRHGLCTKSIKATGEALAASEIDGYWTASKINGYRLRIVWLRASQLMSCEVIDKQVMFACAGSMW